MKHVTIAGGGIAGLATAFYLEQEVTARNLPIRYTLLESAPRLGGKITTYRANGFVVEGGPDSFITQKRGGLDLCDALGLRERLLPCNEEQQTVYIIRKGKSIPVPHGFRMTVPTQVLPLLTTPLLSPWGKLRMALEYFVPPSTSDADESLAAFVRRRLGKEALHRMAAPLMSGIFVADPERLSIRSTFPAFVQMERKYGSLIRAMRHHHRNPPPTHTDRLPLFVSFADGMAELVENLSQRLSGDVRTGCGTAAVSHTNGQYTVATCDDSEPLVSDAVVLAVPADCAAGLVESLSPRLAERLRGIRHVSTANVSLAYRREDVPTSSHLDRFGFLVPSEERRQILACTCSSIKFDHRAPDSHLLLRCFFGDATHPKIDEMPDSELVTMARNDLLELQGIRAEPVLTRVYRWPSGNPQYDVGHLDRMREIESLVDTLDGLYLAGSAYHGIGLPDCIASGRAAAERIVDGLGKS